MKTLIITAAIVLTGLFASAQSKPVMYMVQNKNAKVSEKLCDSLNLASNTRNGWKIVKKTVLSKTIVYKLIYK